MKALTQHHRISFSLFYLLLLLQRHTRRYSRCHHLFFLLQRFPPIRELKTPQMSKTDLEKNKTFSYTGRKLYHGLGTRRSSCKKTKLAYFKRFWLKEPPPLPPPPSPLRKMLPPKSGIPFMPRPWVCSWGYTLPFSQETRAFHGSGHLPLTASRIGSGG